MMARRIAEAVMMADGIKKKIVKVGKSSTKVVKNGAVKRYPRFYIHIPSEFVEELGLDEKQKVEVILDTKSKLLIIKPIKESS